MPLFIIYLLLKKLVSAKYETLGAYDSHFFLFLLVPSLST
jgi:hypothetical protein